MQFCFYSPTHISSISSHSDLRITSKEFLFIWFLNTCYRSSYLSYLETTVISYFSPMCIFRHSISSQFLLLGITSCVFSYRFCVPPYFKTRLIILERQYSMHWYGHISLFNYFPTLIFYHTLFPLYYKIFHLSVYTLLHIMLQTSLCALLIDSKGYKHYTLLVTFPAQHYLVLKNSYLNPCLTDVENTV